MSLRAQRDAIIGIEFAYNSLQKMYARTNFFILKESLKKGPKKISFTRVRLFASFCDTCCMPS